MAVKNKRLMHLLKYKYQSDKRSNSRRYTIIEHRLRFHKAFKHSPNLLEAIFFAGVC